MNQTFVNKLTRNDQEMVHFFFRLRANARFLNYEFTAVMSLSFPFLVSSLR